MIIDIFTHVVPAKFLDRMMQIAPGLADMGKRMRGVTPLFDMDARFRTMDKFGDYRQLVTMSLPSIESYADAKSGPELARIANDAMAELVQRHPDRFAGFAAALFLRDMDASLAEADRAIRTLGAKGVQIFTHVAGRPLDDPAFEPLFKLMAGHDLPLWMHPERGPEMTDYMAEKRSRFETWCVFGWPYDTSVAMTRLVFNGLFDRHPGIKIITHHLGAMIPFFAERIVGAYATLGSRTSDEDYSGIIPGLKRPIGDYFKMYYGDTAIFGSDVGTRCGVDYFGAGHVLFASDAPFAPIEPAIRAIERLAGPHTDRAQIFRGNAERLLKTSFA